jgi:hypothetical protein
MQATFEFSLDLHDDEISAEKFCAAMLSAFRTARAAVKDLAVLGDRPQLTTTPPSLPTPPAQPAKTAETDDVDATLDEVFGPRTGETAKAPPPATEPAPKKRGRPRRSSPTAKVNEPLSDTPPTKNDEPHPFDAPITNIQELVDLGNSVCTLGKEGLAAVTKVLKDHGVGRYGELPKEKWTEIASKWRRQLADSAR